MITRTYHIEFLTPCFCGGADPAHAELRPSAIRGQLHWWFRALGGSPAEEQTVFGGVHGDMPIASTFSIRVIQPIHGGQSNWFTKIPQQGVEPHAYLLGFFCGRTGRLKAGGALAPGSKATVSFHFRRPPASKLEHTLRVFFSIGALGFRATRAAGAFASEECALTMNTWTQLADELKNASFTVWLDAKTFPDWVDLIRHAGNLLKNQLRGRNGLGISAGRNGTRPNALGSAEPRQASPLHLRPVRIGGDLRLALIEAPHSRILGQDAQCAHGNRAPILKLAHLA